MQSPYERSKVGFPIRRSLDQSLFAAPQGLSQRTTSFIASQRQGIHRTPFWHLIALMIDARLAHLAVCSRQHLAVCRSREAPSERPYRRPRARTRRRLASMPGNPTCSHVRLVPRSCFPLHDVTYPQALSHKGSCQGSRSSLFRIPCRHAARHPKRVVEPDGIEPTTSCLQSTRSPN